MKLPSKLLGRVRAGVGIGAVVLGGCDPAASTEGWASGEVEVVAAAEVESAEAVEVEAEAAKPELKPMLLLREDAGEGVAEILPIEAIEPLESIEALPGSRGGVAGVVEKTIVESSSEGEIPAIRDLGRPVEPAESNGFVPYDGGTGAGTIASATPPRVRPKIRPRPRHPVKQVDEPCDPGVVAATPPGGGWDCPACGRG